MPVLALLPLILVAPAWRPDRVFAPCDILAQAHPWRALAPDTEPHNPAQVDAVIQFHPWLIHAAREVRAGRWPLWNPYTACGTRFLANPQTSVLAPFSWPAYLLPPAEALWVSAWLQMFVTGLGMYVLLRVNSCGALSALAGAATYQWCGWNIGWMRDTPGAVAAWTPWLLALGERLAAGGSDRGGPGFAVVTALVLLGGHPETSFFVLLGTAAFVVWRARRDGGMALPVRTAGWGAVGVALAAVLLMPFLDVLRSSEVLAFRLVDANPGLPARALLELLVPLYHGGPMAPPVWDRVGAAPVHVVAGAGALVWSLAPPALASLSRSHRGFARFLLGLAFAAVLVAVENPLTSPLLARVPPFSVAVNAFAMLWVGFAGAAITGLGLQAVLTGGAPRRAARSGMIAGAVAAGAALAACGFDLPRLIDAGAAPAVLARVAGFLVLSAAGLVLIAVAARQSSHRVPAVAGLAVLQFMSLVPYARRTHGTSPAALFYPVTPSLAWLAREAGPGRVLLTLPNSGVAVGLREPTGYDALGYGPLARLLRPERSGVTHGPGPLWFRQPADSPLLDLLAVRYLLVSPGSRLDAPGVRVVRSGVDGTVYRNDDALPRARAVGRAVWRSDPDVIADRIRSDAEPLRGMTWLEGPPGAAGAAAAFPPVEFEVDDPQRVVLRARAPREGWLVLADSWAPGWVARVSGRRVAIRRADVAFRAVPLPAGNHRIEFVFAPPAFAVGLLISCVAAGFLAGRLAIAGRRRPGRPAGPSP